MKKLVIVAHPDLRQSVINKQWVAALEKEPGTADICRLYETYPDWQIDVEKEQRRLEGYDVILFQYPMFWFNCPPLLKKYMDEVFTYGWAYGSKGDKLRGKRFAIAVSTGCETRDFQPDGKCHVTVGELLKPFETAAHFCGMDYKGYFTMDDSHHVTPERLAESAAAYVRFLQLL